MKPKKAYRPGAQDRCYTPPYALGPLLPYLAPFRATTVWEPAVGSGNLERTLRRCGFSVVASDLETGVDFLECEAPEHSLQVTNPPYSIKYLWLKRCYELGRPFALLVPVETIGAKSAQILFKQYGVELLLLDKRVNFETPNADTKPAGWKSSAQFPALWLCWGLLPEAICYGTVVESWGSSV